MLCLSLEKGTPFSINMIKLLIENRILFCSYNSKFGNSNVECSCCSYQVGQHVNTYFSSLADKNVPSSVRRSLSTRVGEAVLALSLCHNVTPIYDNNDTSDRPASYQVGLSGCSTIVRRTNTMCNILTHFMQNLYEITIL